MAEDLAAQVAKALDELRPYLQRSGARVELVGVEERIAHVRVSLRSQGFLLTKLSVVAGLERALRDRVPNLGGVVAVNLPPYAGVGWDKPDFTQKLSRLGGAKEEDG